MPLDRFEYITYSQNSISDFVRNYNAGFVGIDYVTTPSYKTMPSQQKKKLKTFLGDAVRYNASRCNIKILEWAFKRQLIYDEYVETHDGKIVLKYDAWQSGFSGKWHAHNKDCYNYVYVTLDRSKKELWSEKECKDHAIYISYDGRWVAKSLNPTMREIDGYLVCIELTPPVVWDDGTIHLRQRELCMDGLPEYHNSTIPGLNEVEKKLVFGCELELRAKENRMEIYNIAKECGLSGERDGSLHSTLGIEIVGGPETLTDHQNPEGRWLQFLKKIKGKAAAVQRGRPYGLHVSVNRGALSHLHTGKLLTFVHRNPNLCKVIAGRGSNQYSQFYSNRKVSQGKRDETPKYEALSIRSKKRVECRIFKATVTPSNFLRAVEFTAAVVEFTRHASVRELKEAAFTNWLGKNHKNYRNLALHLKVIQKPKKFKKPVAKRKIKIAA